MVDIGVFNLITFALCSSRSINYLHITSGLLLMFNLVSPCFPLFRLMEKLTEMKLLGFGFMKRIPAFRMARVRH